MTRIAGFYVFVQIVIVIAAIAAYVFWDKRYRKNHGFDVPKGFEETDEITIDPSNGKRFRIYYNNITGERFYHEEK
jgi:hypothetical protein